MKESTEDKNHNPILHFTKATYTCTNIPRFTTVVSFKDDFKCF